MKYLVCIFRNNELVKTYRDISEFQLPFLLNSTSQELGIDILELSLFKYNEEDICEYCHPKRRPKQKFKIYRDRIDLINLIEEVIETTITVDTMSHDLSELQSLYSPEDYSKIIQNREYVNNLVSSISYNPEVSIELPHVVPEVQIVSSGVRLIEDIVGTLLPIEG